MPNQMGNDPALLEKNLALFYRQHSEKEVRFDPLDLSEITFCVTDLGEINLQKKVGGAISYYHSQSGVLEEAQRLLKNIDFSQQKAIFVYGIGLGYYFD